MVAKLTDKQKAFANEYLIDMNATQAAIRAGYSEKTANRIGSENLSKPVITEYLAEANKKRQHRTQITQDRVLLELAKIAFASGSDFAKVVTEPRNEKVWNDDDQEFEDKETSIQTVRLKDTDTLPEDKRAAIAEISEGKFGITVKSYDKVKALELIGKHLGMWDKADKKGGDGDENNTGVIMLPEIDETAPASEVTE